MFKTLIWKILVSLKENLENFSDNFMKSFHDSDV